jgi:hypothetical protein
MGSRIVDAIVGLAVLLSAAALVLLFVRPFLPASAGTAGLPSPTAGASASVAASEAPTATPIGSYVLPAVFRPYRCIGVTLEARSYPVASEGGGAATVSWWANDVTDGGNHEACAGGIGQVHRLEARVDAVPDRSNPNGPPVGYTLHFPLPLPGAGTEAVELTLLTSRSTPDRLQAVDGNSGGFLGGGMVFDRVPAIAPSLVPAPSSEPSPSGG